MTVGAKLRSQAASSFALLGPLGRARAEGDEEAEAIVEHLECEEPEAVAAESGARGRRAGSRGGARRVHLAALPERYEPLEEPAPPAAADKPTKRYRRKLRKYGKNVGKVITKGCRYIVIGLQGFAAAYSAPFGVATSVVSFVR
ncbi:required for drug-induced death protein 1-like [Dipodomys merriami]|uniref:required for drug-induced death protein 1-like n=1 Tax=Dipodomys merriami TaxID=94247 RepID=UPI0038560901